MYHDHELKIIRNNRNACITYDVNKDACHPDTSSPWCCCCCCCNCRFPPPPCGTFTSITEAYDADASGNGTLPLPPSLLPSGKAASYDCPRLACHGASDDDACSINLSGLCRSVRVFYQAVVIMILRSKLPEFKHGGGGAIIRTNKKLTSGVSIVYAALLPRPLPPPPPRLPLLRPPRGVAPGLRGRGGGLRGSESSVQLCERVYYVIKNSILGKG